MSLTGSAKFVLELPGARVSALDSKQRLGIAAQSNWPPSSRRQADLRLVKPDAVLDAWRLSRGAGFAIDPNQSRDEPSFDEAKMAQFST